MATIQAHYKWILVFLHLVAISLPQLVSGCHPSSKKLHICLNIYLERDFHHVETIVNGPTMIRARNHFQGGARRHGVIIEGPELTNICMHISTLIDCYSDLLPQCDTLWQYDRYMRLMDVLEATHDYLCINSTDNLRDLLLNTGCLTLPQSDIANCTGFDWSMSWRKVLRMQVSPQDRCQQLESYGNCLKSRPLNEVCDAEAAEPYKKLIDWWLRHWCANNASLHEERRFFNILLNKT